MKLYRKKLVTETKISYEQVISELEELIEKKVPVDTKGFAQMKDISTELAIGFIKKRIQILPGESDLYNFSGIKREYKIKKETKIDFILNKIAKPKYKNTLKKCELASMIVEKQLIITYTKGQSL